MQTIPGSSNPTRTTSIGGGGGRGLRGGLSRFRSAPATWVDALPEVDEDEGDEDDPLKQNQCFTQLLTGTAPKGIDHSSSGRGFSVSYGGGGGGVPGSGFLRQNSLPGVFLGNSGSGGGWKRGREDEFASQVGGEQSGASSSSGLIDLEVDRLFEDSGSAACKFRAKRGCATHPRSIAERVRRTRISDRIRKLQELMPNMDKQINTADMLDEAVEYVKLLQKQIKDLSDQKRNCTCKARECT